MILHYPLTCLKEFLKKKLFRVFYIPSTIHKQGILRSALFSAVVFGALFVRFEIFEDKRRINHWTGGANMK